MSGIDLSPSCLKEPAWLAPILQSLPRSAHYCFALSGGLDSVSLLYFLAPVLRERGALLRAIHVHHGLSPNADAWAQYCLEFCQQMLLPCQVHKVCVVSDGMGLEAAARKARYDVFRQELIADEVLLQGHHLDDQAETVLLRAMRGAAPSGLAAMPRCRSLGRGLLFRPWLSVARKTLYEAAQAESLVWIEDESNQDEGLDRNYLRLKILPAFEQRWPQVRSALARVADQARQQKNLLDELLAPSLDAVIMRTPFGAALQLDHLQPLSSAHREAVIRHWLHELHVPQAPASTLLRFEREMLEAKAGAASELRWGLHSMRVYRRCVFHVPIERGANVLPEPEPIEFELSDLPLRVNSTTWCIQVDWSDVELPRGDLTGIFYACISLNSASGKFCLRSQRQGDALRLPSGQHQSLKQVFQDIGVPPWSRRSWPMLFCGDVLVCAGQDKVDPEYRRVTADECAVPELMIDSSRGRAKRWIVLRWSARHSEYEKP